MITTLPASAPDGASPFDRILCVVIALAGAFEIANGLTDLSILFGNEVRFPGATPTGLTILASVALHPLLGVVAIVFALTRRLPAGIVALALLMLAKWAAEVPSIVHHGLGLAGDPLVVLHRLFRTVLQPLIALAAIAAARPGGNLVAATIAVIVPGLLDIAGIAAFAISIGAAGL
jgi:hypothetical protein